MSEDFLALTGDIVIAHLNHNRVEPAALPELIRATWAALTTLGQPAAAPAAAPPVPAVPIRASVKADHLVCLEDGKKLKMLKRYLRSTFDMSPEDYRAKWGLPADYPMVAPDYSDRRRAIAQEIGLGNARVTAPTPSEITPTESTIEMAPEPESMMVAETPAPAKKKSASRTKTKGAPEAASEVAAPPAAEPIETVEAPPPAKKPRARKAAPIVAAEPALAPETKPEPAPEAKPELAEAPAPVKKPRAKAKAAPAPELDLAQPSTPAPVEILAEPEPAPAPAPEAPAVPVAAAPAPAAKPERKKLSIALGKAPPRLDPEAAAPRPRLKPRYEAPVIDPEPEAAPAPRVQNIDEDRALIVQAIDTRRCLRWVYNRTTMVVAPYVLYTSRDELFVDAVAYEKNGVTPAETKLGRFKLTGLSALQPTTRPYPAGDRPDMSDARYQEKVVAQV